MAGKHYDSDDRTCYCLTCSKDLHYLGVARHRAMHRDKREDCLIQMTDGRILKWEFSRRGR